MAAFVQLVSYNNKTNEGYQEEIDEPMMLSIESTSHHKQGSEKSLVDSAAVVQQ